MNMRFRTRAILTGAIGAMLLASGAHAGAIEDAMRDAQRGGNSSAAPAPAPQQSAPRGDRGRADRGDRGGDRGDRGGDRGSRFSRAAPPANNAPPAAASAAPRRGDRGVIGSTIERNFDRSGPGGSYQPSRRPPRYVSNLPGGYRQYNWNGRPYYSHGGHWYRPYGSRYVLVGAPYGLFVSYLPGYYSTFWFGNTRYYYADDTYYLYEPARRGYVVTRSPYGDDRDDEVSSDADEDLYVYPAKGQSEQQQADDRYDCHRWAADQTHYDPIDSDYDADKRADYLRAMTACLTGRGYSVK